MSPITTVCPSCRARIVFRNMVEWKSGYIRCPSCKSRVYVELSDDKESGRKNKKIL